jgi:transcription-repair coupling factor (superfamily II helicase)
MEFVVPRTAKHPTEASTSLPLAAMAARLVQGWGNGSGTLLCLMRSERRAGLLSTMMRDLAPELTVLAFAAWDCVPYDRAAPSRDVMAGRIGVLRQLAQSGSGTIVITTPEAMAQRAPPRSTWKSAEFRLKRDDPLDLDALQAFLLRTGYVLDERVDETGEAALRGAVLDIFPAEATDPVRIDHGEGRITGIRRYEAASQRTLGEFQEVLVTPVSELVLPDVQEQPTERFPGIEHLLASYIPDLETLFDYIPAAHLFAEPGAEQAYEDFHAQILDAFEMRLAAPRSAGERPLPPSALYVEPDEWSAALGALTSLDLSTTAVEPIPRFARATDPRAALGAYASEALQEGRTVLLAGAAAADRRVLIGPVKRVVDEDARWVRSWDEALRAEPGSLLTIAAALDHGFVDLDSGVAVIAAADLLGARARDTPGKTAPVDLGLGDGELRPGDIIVHIDHGVGRLTGIETLAPEGGVAGDALVLEFADGAKLLVPVEDFSRIWRYGAASEKVALDRLGGEAWAKRRAELQIQIQDEAQRLVALAAERASKSAEPLVAPPRDYDRFAAGFRFSETADQARAIEAVLEDLASERPMNRLVCGDVGFGKTEVALRAAAAAALAGKQVAVAAPTTVLVRQHVQTFRRRFAGLGIEVAHLSRLVGSAEARSVKEGLADGVTPIVIGTQALAAKGVHFKDLGLLIIDEEQRFGTKQKEALRSLGQGVHTLALTATPIPRTLQSALVGLQDLSLIATPPQRRQPVRTFLAPFDPVTVRTALIRERRRGGQSFVVCPRIEDMEPLAGQLRNLVPELQLVQAHGRMPAETIDAAMVDFADGVGDVLLATNIIESGLDVPRANTILIWRPDRFGLAQLHQLRGRVGRGRARGTAYLLTDPEQPLSKATEQRLRTLEAFDRLGAGFAISGRDLDLRGAGDLVGEEQAGHVKLIGLALYQVMLVRALAVARGEAPEPDWTPTVHLGIAASIPADYVPEPEIRIGLHARLARLGPDEDPQSLAEEIEDRFGPLPEEVTNLVSLAVIRAEARRLGVEALDAGPEALAASFQEGAAIETARRMHSDVAAAMEWRGERLLWGKRTETAEERRNGARAFLKFIAGAAPKAKTKKRVKPRAKRSVAAA